MTMNGEYLDMLVAIDDLDKSNQEFYSHCGTGTLHLQFCSSCALMRYPTTTACPWCASPDYDWRPVSGNGTIYSYCEVHHAIQPVFRQFLPYMILLVELDEQAGEPGRTRWFAGDRQPHHGRLHAGATGRGGRGWHRDPGPGGLQGPRRRTGFAPVDARRRRRAAGSTVALRIGLTRNRSGLAAVFQ